MKADEQEKDSKTKPHDTVTVNVNEQPVKLREGKATGRQIKEAAIEQGVDIKLDYLLEEEISDHKTRLIEDKEEVRLIEHIHFTARPADIAILVNEQKVVLHQRKATGTQIKAAAIAQGVLIQPNFILQEELPNGHQSRNGDNDTVRLHEHQRFTAIAPDDNS